MPLYDYECYDCGYIIELVRPYEEEKTYDVCPRCCNKRHEGQLAFFNRKFSPSKNFKLKGKGWYVTDYGVKKDVKDD